MTIQAQLEDGRVLEFPDGTDPKIIQSTVKRIVSGQQPEQVGVGAALGAGFRRGIEKITGGAGQRGFEALIAFNQSQLADLAEGINSGEIEPTEEVLVRFDRLSSQIQSGRKTLEGAEKRELQRRGEIAPIQAQRPIATAIGEVGGQITGGSIIPGLGVGPAAATLPGRIAVGAAQGTALGAVQPTVGEESIAAPAGIGGIIGGLAPPVLERVVAPIVRAAAAPIVKALGRADEAVVKPAAAKISREVAETPQFREAARVSEETGIPLFRAQRTLDPAQLEKQSFVSQLPAGVQRASKALESQNKAASQAVDDLLTRIAPDDAVIVGAERFRSASNRVVELAKQSRAEKTSPLFNQAFKKGGTVNLGPVDDFVGKVKNEFPVSGEVPKSVNKALKLISESDGNLRKLANAKIEIDQMINKVGEGSLGNTTKSNLTQLKNALLAQMDEASPLYQSARQEFARLSPDVEAVQNSIIGKIANLDDVQIKSISRQVFDPAETNPTVIQNARKLIDEADPAAWNILMRSEIERRMGSIKPEIGGAVENIPGQISRAIFGNAKQRNVLLAGADKNTKKMLISLDSALRRAKLGRGLGSQTAAREEIKKELRGGISQGVRDLFRKPISTITEAGESAVFDRRVAAMAQALFNPKFRVEAAKALKANKGSDFARLVLSIEALSLAESEGPATAQPPQPSSQ